jgi:hypothetical protein
VAEDLVVVALGRVCTLQGRRYIASRSEFRGTAGTKLFPAGVPLGLPRVCSHLRSSYKNPRENLCPLHHTICHKLWRGFWTSWPDTFKRIYPASEPEAKCFGINRAKAACGGGIKRAANSGVWGKYMYLRSWKISISNDQPDRLLPRRFTFTYRPDSSRPHTAAACACVVLRLPDAVLRYYFLIIILCGGVVTSVYDDLQHPVSHGVEHSISHIPDDNDVAGRLLSIKDLQALDTQRPLIRLHQSCKWQSHPLLGAPAV